LGGQAARASSFWGGWAIANSFEFSVQKERWKERKPPRGPKGTFFKKGGGDFGVGNMKQKNDFRVRRTGRLISII